MEDIGNILQALQALETIVKWVGSIAGGIILVMMYFVNRHDQRLKTLEDKYSNIRVDLPENYLLKSEHRRAMDIINENQALAYARLEKGQSELKKELKDELTKTDSKLDRIFEKLDSKADK